MFTPQYSDFQIIILFKKIINTLFYLIFFLSVVISFISKDSKFYLESINTIGESSKFYLETANIIAMVSYSILTFYIDYYLFPSAERIRRKDFIDNSFGTQLNVKQSEGYFSNEENERGIYKSAVNLFENSLFTTNISKKMLPKKMILSTVFVIVIIFLAVNGFSNTQFAVPTLQVFLSANILGESIKLFLFVRKNEIFFDNLRDLFTNLDFKLNPEKYLPQFFKIYADYETNLAWGMILLNSKIYDQLNPELSQEWIFIKEKFKI